MNLSIPSLFEDKLIIISEITLDDFRTISFLIENNNDLNLQKFLFSKIDTPCNCFDKFYALLQARTKFVNENIILNNGTANITINLDLWKTEFEKNIKKIGTTIYHDEFAVTIDYPSEFLYETLEDFIIESIYMVSYKYKDLNFLYLSKNDKYTILDKMPPAIFSKVKDYIVENSSKPICLMSSRLGLDDINVGLFDNSAFSLIKNIYNYYNYDDILETIYFLSKRITDISYLNSRTPRDIEVLVDLYSDEVDKTTEENKITI